MLSKIIEVSDQANWGKMLVQEFDEAELARKSSVGDGETVLGATAARRSTFATGDPRDLRLVIDLQTHEGALFDLTTCAPERDLDRHQIWVCPLFLPFPVLAVLARTAACERAP
jgi:hypothetical protein